MADDSPIEPNEEQSGLIEIASSTQVVASDPAPTTSRSKKEPLAWVQDPSVLPVAYIKAMPPPYSSRMILEAGLRENHKAIFHGDKFRYNPVPPPPQKLPQNKTPGQPNENGEGHRQSAGGMNDEGKVEEKKKPKRIDAARLEKLAMPRRKNEPFKGHTDPILARQEEMYQKAIEQEGGNEALAKLAWNERLAKQAQSRKLRLEELDAFRAKGNGSYPKGK